MKNFFYEICNFLLYGSQLYWDADYYRVNEWRTIFKNEILSVFDKKFKKKQKKVCEKMSEMLL